MARDMHKKIIQIILFITITFGTAIGAGSNFCKYYAQEAVGQYYLAQYLHIPHIYPPAWQMNYEAHKKWCELPFTSKQIANNEIIKRKQTIDKYYQEMNPMAQKECIVHKHILPNGDVEIKYCDGRIKTKSHSGTLMKYPDGHIEKENKIVPYTLNVIMDNLPAEPEFDAIKWWVGTHAQKLLNIIKTGIQDEKVFQSYLEYEDKNLSIFQKMEKRTQTLEYFVTP